ncbi:MAG TPA: hypothetical protein VGO03_12455 [Acidimicrobiia bacterium]|jgi:hypothetical protein
MIRRRRRAVRTVLGAILVAAGGGILLQSSPSTASTLGGAATISDPANAQPLASGASDTLFTVALPSGAACSGDTATDGYHVYSYMVTPSTDVSTVTFINSPSVGYGFVDNTGTYYGAANTAINTGQIIGIPTNFEWAPLLNAVPLTTLLNNGTSATWDAGIACADTTGKLSDNWNVAITFTADSSDPNGFTWTAGGGTPPPTTTTTPGQTTTTVAGETTTTVSGETTTTIAGATTTTTPSGDTTTTTASGDTTTTTASTGTCDPLTGTNCDTTSTTSATGVISPAGSDPSGGGGTGSLAFTGTSLSHNVAIALLLLGFGLMLVGSEMTLRGKRVLEGAWQALR